VNKMHKITIGTDLTTGKPFTIDADEIIMGRTFLASITRYGKSFTNRRIIEQLFGSAGMVIIDAEGEYGSLREKFPFLIIGKDIPLQLETAEFMAETMLKEDLSVIIDLSLTDEDIAKEYVAAFLKRFMFLETKLRKPYLIVCEEADEMMPEKGVAKATSLRAFKNIAKKGGKRGVGLIVTTHRPAFVSKMVLSQCTTLKIIGRIEWASDLDVIKEFLQVSPDVLRRPKKNGKPVNDGKPHVDCLNAGQFYFSGSAVPKDAFVKVGKVLTTHLGATPGLIPPTPKELKGVISRLNKELPKIIEKIKPSIPPVEEIRKGAEQKAEVKYRKKYERDKMKLEAKFKGEISESHSKIKELEGRVDALSRSAALTTSKPITDVLQHPIVCATMLKLPERARDLLTKVQREPDLTREQLAAFLSASRDTIANIIKKINRTFKATVIIGRGRPIKYRSMLERLFITDVAEREISEIERLQAEVRKLKANQGVLTDKSRALYSENAMLKEQQKRMPSPEQVSALQNKNEKLRRSVQEQKRLVKEADKTLVRFKKAFNTIEQTLKPLKSVESTPESLNEPKQPFVEQLFGSAGMVEVIKPAFPELPTERQEFIKETKPIIVREPNTITEDVMKFLQKHPNIFFSYEELAIALGYNISDESFQRALASLPSSVEKTEKGLAIKNER